MAMGEPIDWVGIVSGEKYDEEEADGGKELNLKGDLRASPGSVSPRYGVVSNDFTDPFLIPSGARVVVGHDGRLTAIYGPGFGTKPDKGWVPDWSGPFTPSSLPSPSIGGTIPPWNTYEHTIIPPASPEDEAEKLKMIEELIALKRAELDEKRKREEIIGKRPRKKKSKEAGEEAKGFDFMEELQNA